MNTRHPVIPPEVKGVWMVCFWGPVIPPHQPGVWKPRVNYQPKQCTIVRGNPSRVAQDFALFDPSKMGHFHEKMNIFQPAM